MSTEERAHDSGEHGYGSAKQDSNIEEAEGAVDDSDGERNKAGDSSEETENRRAAASLETASNVTRSTQGVTVGGSKKDPDSADESRDLSNAEQAVENQKQDLESGKESPG